MTYSKRKLTHCQYFVEEDDDLRVGQNLDIPTVWLFIVLFVVILFLTALFLWDIATNGFHILGLFLFAPVFVLFSAIYFYNLFHVVRMQYSLVISSQGIKSITYKETVFLPWDEFKEFGVIEKVKLSADAKRSYFNLIYISNFSVDENTVRSATKSTNARSYIKNGEMLIILPHLNLSANDLLGDKELIKEDSDKELYFKIKQYIEKFNV